MITPEQLPQFGTTQLGAALARLVPSISFPQPTTISGAGVVRAGRFDQAAHALGG